MKTVHKKINDCIDKTASQQITKMTLRLDVESAWSVNLGHNANKIEVYQIIKLN